MTRRVMENLGVRLKECLRNGGRHLWRSFQILKWHVLSFLLKTTFIHKDETSLCYFILKTLRFFYRTLSVTSLFRVVSWR
jgi:hypothetical protein